MAKVSLRIYNREIESLIDQGHLDEAVAHCHHILQTFPKHLETYRLLGKACLEAKRHADAVDIFSRVLMAVPDDFVSHVGMSIVRDDENKLDDAIWHMERAFESQPSNAAIQGELQRLYGRRDGMEPPKIRMTRGALAYMYVQGELYPQAISEIRAVLSQDPQRADMQVLLARAYFRGGQKTDAADMCTQLIKRYPYCFDANRIMVEILPGSDRAESTQAYRHRVNELDPYAAFAKESVFRSSEVTDASINLERLEYQGRDVEMSREWGTSLGIGLSAGIAKQTEQPEWLKSGGEAPLEPSIPSALQGESELPDFLRDAGWTESSGAAEDGTTYDASLSDDLSPANIPDWLKNQMPEAPLPSAKPAASSSADESLDWLSGMSASSDSQSMQTESASAVDVPDWLSGLSATPDSQSMQTESASAVDVPDWLGGLNATPEKGQTAQPETAAESEIPDWLGGLGLSESAEPASTETTSQEIPDWMGGMTSSPIEQPAPQSESVSQTASMPDWLSPQSESELKSVEPMAAETPKPKPTTASLDTLGTSAKEQDDAVAWLEMLASKHGAKAEELVTDPAARTEKPPEWVEQARSIAGAESVARPAEEDATGHWLDKLDKEEPSKKAVEAEPSDVSDWLSGLDSKPAAPVADWSEEPAQETAPRGTDLPDWLSGLDNESPVEEKTVEDQPQVDVSNWLIGLDEKTPVEVSDKPQTKPLDSTKVPDVPNWLSGLESSTMEADDTGQLVTRQFVEEPLNEEPVSIATEASLPDWLAGLDREETDLDETEQAGSHVQERRDDLPSWLQGDFREEEEPHPTPITPADWRPAEPPPISAPKPAPQPVQPVAEKRIVEKPVAEKLIVEKPAAPPPSPRKPAAQKPAREKPVAEPPQAGASGLEQAQGELNRGDIPAALDHYSKLIKKGKFLDEIIRDLRESLYRYPVEVSIWQALGDAYMRANRLQDALNSYNKAEELLR